MKYIIHNVGPPVQARPPPSCRSRSLATTVPACTSPVIWKDGKNLFAGNGYAGLSETACTTSAASSSTPRRMNAITNRAPTPTSVWFRARSSGQAGLLGRTVRLRSASRTSPRRRPAASKPASRIRCQPVPVLRPLLMAGLDGIQNKIHPGDPAGQEPVRPAAGSLPACAPPAMAGPMRRFTKYVDPYGNVTHSNTLRLAPAQRIAAGGHQPEHRIFCGVVQPRQQTSGERALSRLRQLRCAGRQRALRGARCRPIPGDRRHQPSATAMPAGHASRKTSWINE